MTLESTPHGTNRTCLRKADLWEYRQHDKEDDKTFLHTTSFACWMSKQGSDLRRHLLIAKASDNNTSEMRI